MVDGIPQLSRNLKKLVDDLKKVGYPAMETGADKVVTTAKLLCPKGETGRLAASIKRSGRMLSSKQHNPMIEVSAGADDPSLIVGTTDKYNLARIKEYGARRSGQEAEPFLRPAMRRHRPGIRRAIRAAIKKRLMIEGE